MEYEHEQAKEKVCTIVNLAEPMGTRSLRELALAPLGWPRKGVGRSTLPELSMEAILMTNFFLKQRLSDKCGRG